MIETENITICGFKHLLVSLCKQLDVNGSCCLIQIIERIHSDISVEYAVDFCTSER